MDGLISPPTSAGSPSPSLNHVSASDSLLPRSRQHPLRPGSDKEVSLINYLDGKLLRISRRYGKKFTDSDAKDDTPGYESMDEVLADIDLLIDVVWISGTTYLQTSYLLSIAGILLGYLPSFPFSTSIFGTLTKLDMAFATLLQPPPSVPLTSQNPLSVTDKVRIKSLIEETRVAAVNCAFSAGYSASMQDLSSDDEDEDDETQSEDQGEVLSTDAVNKNDEAVGIALSKVYKKTLEIVGDTLTIT